MLCLLALKEVIDVRALIQLNTTAEVDLRAPDGGGWC
jgi:hypothetical protein